MKEYNTWSLTPEALEWIRDFIVTHKSCNIVECGSGASSVMLAELAQQSPGLRFTSLEHDLDWLQDTQAQLAENNLAQFTVALQHTPLVPISLPPAPTYLTQDRSLEVPDTHQWYDYKSARRQRCDLLIVDGPPGPSSRFSRLPAPYFIAIQTGGYIILDDYERADEQSIVARWQEEFGFRLIETVDFNTRLVVLQKPRWAWLRVQWGKLRRRFRK
jgi:hypothetical protein